MLIIGDVRNRVGEYLDCVNSSKEVRSVQLGNFGLKNSYDKVLDSNLDTCSHNILLSSYDYYPYAQYQPLILDDFGFFKEGENTFGYIRGSESKNLKRCYRTEVVDPMEEDYCDLCFPTDEQLNYWHFVRILDQFPANNPKILLTSELPQTIYEQLFDDPRSTHTRRNLDTLWYTWQPEIWVFSNYNTAIIKQVDKTKFIGLADLQTTTL